MTANISQQLQMQDSAAQAPKAANSFGQSLLASQISIANPMPAGPDRDMSQVYHCVRTVTAAVNQDSFLRQKLMDLHSRSICLSMWAGQGKSWGNCIAATFALSWLLC